MAHDPNIGALSIIAAALRRLGWKNEIEITQHGLSQKHLTHSNKFVIIANQINIKLQNLIAPKPTPHIKYWHYENEGEKLGTIFIHLVVESFTNGYSIYENHAGCERGYFITSTNEHIAISKYSDRAKYKNGDTSKIIAIPDLILLDFARNEIINIEGKRYQFREDGIKELNNYGDIEYLYVKKFYPKYKIIRTVVLYGGSEKTIVEIEVGFLLNNEGDLILGIKAPEIFKDAIKRLIEFWS